MKNYLFIIIAILTISCKEIPMNVQDRKGETIVNKKTNDSEIQEIGKLYQPEKIETKQIKSESDIKKDNYEITLTNSDLLDTDLKNIKKHSKKIAAIYYKFLVRINSPFNYNKIIVKIIHRNGKIESYKHSEIEKWKMENELIAPNSQKFELNKI